MLNYGGIIMIPHIIEKVTFESDMAMDRYVERIHDDFNGCFNFDGCGKITFLGDILASTEVLVTERVHKSREDWADFILSNGEKVRAIALTIIKEDEQGLYKETAYLNNKYSSAIIYKTYFNRQGSRKLSREDFREFSYVYGIVLKALGIRY